MKLLPSRLILLPLCLFSGCDETVPLDVQSLEFHDRNHLDQAPKAKMLASSGTTQSQIDLLPVSQCHWMSANEDVSLSWDTVVHFHHEEANISSISACTNAEPGTGTPILIDGEPPTTFAPWPELAKITACVSTPRSQGPNLYRECRVPDSGCYEMPSPCGSASGNTVPYCGNGCLMRPIQDTYSTFKIESEGPASDSPVSQAFSPAFFGLLSSKPFARKMTFHTRDSNLDEHKSVWTWRVRTLPDGRWEESYSPQLMITRIRAFVLDSTAPGGRRYLRLRSGKPVTIEGISFQPCDANPADETEATADSCEPLLGATPGYQHTSLGRPINTPLVWNIEIMGGSDAPENYGLTGTSQVYIEFWMMNKLGNPGNVNFSPQNKNLGAFELHNGPYALDQIFKMDNTHTPDTWTLDDIHLDGPNAAEFTPVVFGSRTQVNPGGSLLFGVTFSPASLGNKAAQLHIALHNQNGTPLTFSAPIQTTVRWSAKLEIDPRSLSFGTLPIGAGPADPRNNRKSILIKNTGGTGLKRSEIKIKPSDSPFEVRAFKARSAPPRSLIIRPGENETIDVLFSPAVARSGSHTAELTISTNAGDGGVELQWS